MIKSEAIIMIMLKLIEAKRFGDRNTINIEYSRRIKEWVPRKKKLKTD